MSSCPRCGSTKTSRSLRKPEPGASTVIEDQNCDSCGWHGTGTRTLSEDQRVPAEPAKKPRKKKQGDLFAT